MNYNELKDALFNSLHLNAHFQNSMRHLEGLDTALGLHSPDASERSIDCHQAAITRARLCDVESELTASLVAVQSLKEALI